MLLGEGEKQARELFAKAGLESPGLCARLLMAKATGLDKLGCLLQEKRRLSAAEEKLFLSLVERHAQGEPLAYILEKKEFYEHEFAVSSATLVPRPETELLVELALKIMPAKKITFADFGCGCGCIGLSLLALRPQWTGFLLELSPDSLLMARINAARIAPQAQLLLGDLMLPPFACGSLDLIVSNPPYIARTDKDVMPDVVAYEPHLALFSGEDGLGHLSGVIKNSIRLLRTGGAVLVEHGAGQAEDVAAILQAAGFSNIGNYADLAGKTRCSVGRKH